MAAGEGVAITVRDLEMAYGSFVIQRDLNFEVRHGDVFVIKDDIETLCATMLQTIMVLPESQSRPAG